MSYLLLKGEPSFYDVQPRSFFLPEILMTVDAGWVSEPGVYEDVYTDGRRDERR